MSLSDLLPEYISNIEGGVRINRNSAQMLVIEEL